MTPLPLPLPLLSSLPLSLPLSLPMALAIDSSRHRLATTTTRTQDADRGDGQMEGEGAAAAATGGLEGDTGAVYAVLDDCVHAVTAGGVRQLDTSAADERNNSKTLCDVIEHAHGGVISCKDIDAATAASMVKVAPRRLLIPEPSGEVASAFQAPYVGDADVQFRRYLDKCCATYRDHRDKYASPSVVLTQSSGFGKSRVVFNLAIATAAEALQKREGPTTTVLYLCARMIEWSSGYPAATSELRRLFFHPHVSNEQRVERLLAAFAYAKKHRDTAGEEWLSLFTTKNADYEIIQRISSLATSEPEAKKPRNDPDSSTLSADDHLTLVLAVDEARTLLETTGRRGVNFLELLHEALSIANKLLGQNGCIFAVLVDTDPRVHMNALPTFAKDSTAVMFPPFVLTETMDVMLQDDGRSSMQRVVSTDAVANWLAIMSMGRPMWAYHVRCYEDYQVHSAQYSVVRFAAHKLLLGCDFACIGSYDEDTLYGVASVFCRLGLHAYPSSAYAPRMIANAMSVLHYVAYGSGAHISGYPSEPVLAFGASVMWYQMEPPALESVILRRFTRMLIQGVVEYRSVGDVVARIFLLVAMDCNIMGDAWTGGFRRRNFAFSGQFCSVASFMATLIGSEPALVDSKGGLVTDSAANERFRSWRSGWDTWKISFSQFAELSTPPTEETLWMLLDRRAAAVLPRDQLGAQLLIPIFCVVDEPKVSFLLVNIENQVAADDRFPASALEHLSPAYVFKEDGPLREVEPRKMIRLYMSLREKETTSKPAQSVLVADGDHGHEAYSLCVRGVFESGAPESNLWLFMSPDLKRQLIDIANAERWNARTQIEMDLEDRDKDWRMHSLTRKAMPRAHVEEGISHTLNLFGSG